MASSHNDRDSLMEMLKSLDIETKTIEHPEVFTVEAMMEHLDGKISGAVSKNLFLKDKKKKLWLFSARHDLDVKLNDLSKKVGASGGLRFADESILQEKLGVRQGCVTAFALINDKERQVNFIIDQALLSGKFQTINFHPLANNATTSITPDDLLKFLKATGHDPIRVNLDE